MKTGDNVKSSIMAYIGSGIGVLAIIAVLIIVFGSWYNIPAGSVGVKFNKMGPNQGFDYNELQQGFGLKMPFVQTVYDIPFRTQSIGFYGSNEEKGTYSAIVPKDLNGIDFTVDVTVRYRLDPVQAAEFIEQKGQGIAAMETLLATAARADSTRGVFGQYAQENVPEFRIEIAQEIRKVMQARIDQEASRNLKPGFIIVEAVDIRDVAFNQRIEERIIQKQEKLQEAQEMEYKILTANRTREMEIINADRDRQTAILRAEGEGEAIKIVAFAKADGIKAVNDAYQAMPMAYVYTKYAEAIKPTDKMYFGFDSLGGDQLSFLNMNEIMAAAQVTGQTTSTPQGEK